MVLLQSRATLELPQTHYWTVQQAGSEHIWSTPVPPLPPRSLPCYTSSLPLQYVCVSMHQWWASAHYTGLGLKRTLTGEHSVSIDLPHLFCYSCIEHQQTTRSDIFALGPINAPQWPCGCPTKMHTWLILLASVLNSILTAKAFASFPSSCTLFSLLLSKSVGRSKSILGAFSSKTFLSCPNTWDLDEELLHGGNMQFAGAKGLMAPSPAKASMCLTGFYGRS